jgi:hypothetical protein
VIVDAAAQQNCRNTKPQHRDTQLHLTTLIVTTRL